MNKNGFEFHHMGIVVQDRREGERYSAPFKMYTSGGNDADFRIQYHRFEQGCPLHPLIQTLPHVAFKVADLEKAIHNRRVIMQPYEPFEGFKVAMIEVDGAPVELLETTLSEEQIWDNKSHKDSVIYPKND